MNIEGMSVFKNFKEYFDDVRDQLSETHQDLMSKLDQKEVDDRPTITMPDMPTHSANL